MSSSSGLEAASAGGNDISTKTGVDNPDLGASGTPPLGQSGGEEMGKDNAGWKYFSSESPGAVDGASAPDLNASEDGIEPAGKSRAGNAQLDTEMRPDSTIEIEREASEHLARRAAEITIDTSVTGDEGRPEKGLGGTSPSSAVSSTNGAQRDLRVTDEKAAGKHSRANGEARNDIPEAPRGAAEATGAEIQNIMDQFESEQDAPGEDEIMSPRLDRQQSIMVLPQRTTSLESLQDASKFNTHGEKQLSNRQRRRSGFSTTSQPSPGPGLENMTSGRQDSSGSAKAASIFQPPPPSPDPEPALPFDFHRFLEQLRHRSADPVAKFLRSFLNEFGKKQWMVHEQVKITTDFLHFIAKKMAQCEVWRTVSDAEFDNAREGMEKLVMNRLYSQTFSPAIPQLSNTSRRPNKGSKSVADMANPQGPGRRGQHQEDVERDEVIAQKIRIYGWIQEEHLDMKPITEKGSRFLALAQKELLKINTYRAPRDKVICVLNCCKVIFGYLKNSKEDQSADAFVPLFIYTVLRARPEHLVSNVQYIWRFRNQDKLGGEAGYYMSSLMGVVAFIENLDRTNLTITDQEFEKNVEQAVSAIAEKNKADEHEQRGIPASPAPPTAPRQHLSEKSGLSRPEVTPRNSMEAEQSSPIKSHGGRAGEKGHKVSLSGEIDDYDAVSGLLKTIKRPLSSIGRIFSEDGPSHKVSSRTSSRAPPVPPKSTGSAPQIVHGGAQQTPSIEGQLTAADQAARKASVESAQAQSARVQEHKIVAE